MDLGIYIGRGGLPSFGPTQLPGRCWAAADPEFLLGGRRAHTAIAEGKLRLGQRLRARANAGRRGGVGQAPRAGCGQRCAKEARGAVGMRRVFRNGRPLNHLRIVKQFPPPPVTISEEKYPDSFLVYRKGKWSRCGGVWRTGGRRRLTAMKGRNP